LLPVWILQEVEVINFPIPPITLGSAQVAVPLEGQDMKRLAGLAATKDQKLLLRLNDVEAAHQPGASWEVYVGLPANATPDPEGPFFVGLVVLFGTGIRDEAHHEFLPASFQFAVNGAVQAAMKSNSTLSLTFVPHGILIDGKPSHPDVASEVHINKVSIAVTTEKQSQEKQ